jgi:hypothetical protein
VVGGSGAATGTSTESIDDQPVIVTSRRGLSAQSPSSVQPRSWTDEEPAPEHGMFATTSVSFGP